jgi:hypothetical protein
LTFPARPSPPEQAVTQLAEWAAHDGRDNLLMAAALLPLLAVQDAGRAWIGYAVIAVQSSWRRSPARPRRRRRSAASGAGSW